MKVSPFLTEPIGVHPLMTIRKMVQHPDLPRMDFPMLPNRQHNH